jgi:isochorismate synthase EntC
MTPGGEGKLAVMLRCALLHGECADLFAGAGIVADSDPQAELEETDLKLSSILEALENA